MEEGLLSSTEYETVTSDRLTIDEERCRALLSILMTKGQGGFDCFCEVLLHVPGQEYIATEILKYARTFPMSNTDRPQSSGEVVEIDRAIIEACRWCS